MRELLFKKHIEFPAAEIGFTLAADDKTLRKLEEIKADQIRQTMNCDRFIFRGTGREPEGKRDAYLEEPGNG